MARKLYNPKTKEKRLPRIKAGDKIPHTGYYYVESNTRIKPVRHKKRTSPGGYRRTRAR